MRKSEATEDDFIDLPVAGGGRARNKSAGKPNYDEGERCTVDFERKERLCCWCDCEPLSRMPTAVMHVNYVHFDLPGDPRQLGDGELRRALVRPMSLATIKRWRETGHAMLDGGKCGPLAIDKKNWTVADTLQAEAFLKREGAVARAEKIMTWLKEYKAGTFEWSEEKYRGIPMPGDEGMNKKDRGMKRERGSGVGAT